MPSYTLIALLLSTFGAIMALISALRNHHSETVKYIREDYKTTCNFVKNAHAKDGEIWKNVATHQKDIENWLWRWDKSVVAPIWAFSLVVGLVCVGTLLIDWPCPENPKIGLPAADQCIISHPIICKWLVGSLLTINVMCYILAIFSQKKARMHHDAIKVLQIAVRESNAAGIQPAS